MKRLFVVELEWVAGGEEQGTLVILHEMPE